VTEKFPRKVVYCATKITFLLQERLQQQLDEQAQRYEEQLTELHSVIAELTRKLHQQRTMAIAEEDEVSGNGGIVVFCNLAKVHIFFWTQNEDDIVGSPR
jgi:alkyl sulfatase BDS1-like metallo-beta-lactamase superfamily hydrolase